MYCTRLMSIAFCNFFCEMYRFCPGWLNSLRFRSVQGRQQLVGFDEDFQCEFQLRPGVGCIGVNPLEEPRFCGVVGVIEAVIGEGVELADEFH